MPIRDTTLKTSVRMPKALHAELERAAEAAGLTVNGEMVYRMQHDPRREAASALLAEIGRRDTSIVDALRKQNAALWRVIERTDTVLADVLSAMVHVMDGSEAATLKREVEFARELIGATKAHR